MSHIINRILGRDDESSAHSHSHSHSSDVKHENTSSSSSTSKDTAAHTMEGRTVERDGVNIKSTVSSDATSTISLSNQQKLNDLVSRLGSTHTQIDQYAKQQTDRINDEIQREIDQVLARTRLHQEELLRQANENTAQIDAEYRARLQKMVEEIDAVKAKRIAEIENELNEKQTGILQAARAEIDQLNQKAAQLKIGALQQAQAKATSDAQAITAEAANIGQTSTVHQSTGTTTIKTEVSAASTNKEASGSHADRASASTFHGDHAATADCASGQCKTSEKTQIHTKSDRV